MDTGTVMTLRPPCNQHGRDENGKIHGEHKLLWRNGNVFRQCMMEHGIINGEHKRWHEDGSFQDHLFLKSHKCDITEEIKALVNDMNNITDEERTLIKLAWNVQCLPTECRHD